MDVFCADVCLGCGDELKVKDRRVLGSDSSKHVLQVWRSFFEEKLEELGIREDVDTDSLVKGSGDEKKAGKVCRKCFSAFERYEILRRSIEKSIEDVLEAMVPDLEVPSPKRQREGPPTSRPFFASSSQPGSSKSPNVMVHISKQRTHMLTPSRKRMGKAVARKSYKAVAEECWKSPDVRRYIMCQLGTLLRQELKKLCSDETQSILRTQSLSNNPGFSWSAIYCEIQLHAPLLFNLLLSMTKTRQARSNRKAVICVCAAVLLKYRFSKMSLLQKVVSLILYAGHSSKQVYDRLHKMEMCMSHKTTVRLINQMGKFHDRAMLEWQSELLSVLIAQEEEESQTQVHVLAQDSESSEEDSGPSTDDESDESRTTVTTSGSEDIHLSPPSDFESPDESVLLHEPSDPACPPSKTCQPSLSVTPVPISTASSTSTTSMSEPHQSSSISALDPTGGHTKSSPSTPSVSTYKLVGDNLDDTVTPRFARADSQGKKSLHYFNSYAIKDRIDFSHLSPFTLPTCHPSPAYIAASLLPSVSDDQVIKRNMTTLVSRIIVSHMHFFNTSFADVVDWHITHKYYAEMSQKSKVVPLGVIPKNENKGSEMVDIMVEHHKYVPVVTTSVNHFINSTGESVTLQNAKFSPIIMGGDHLTAERARGAIRIRMNSDTPVKQLQGLIPISEDWHAKLNMLELIWRFFYSSKSAADHSTLYQLKNLLGISNISKPKTNFNGCEDFLRLSIECHILAAATELFQMSTLGDNPSQEIVAEDVWLQSKENKKHILEQLSEAVVSKAICFQFNSSTTSTCTGVDRVQQYAVELHIIGLFYLEFCDAIKEGDGERVLRCWRYMLPIFHNTGRKNYAKEAFNILYLHDYVLPPRLAAQSIWSRFVNVHGCRGRNIPADLHNEHLNRLCKEAVRSLGSNKKESAIIRVSRALGTISPVLDTFDEENEITTPSGRHRIASATRDRNIIINELLRNKVFNCYPNRKHTTFPQPTSLLHMNKTVKNWIIMRLNN